ncbi:MAG: ATP-binding protein [Gemmataceae bacterium]|nr:ATP-binding protein [Gemmataceae bacterium]
MAASLHVLVIDDDADARANLRDILELDEYIVATAGSAAEALNRDNWPVFFAILLDRKLPDGSADLLLPQLRQLAPAAAILIVTGYADLEGAITAIRQGAVDYITKPINPDLIRSRLANVAQRKRAEAEVARLNEQAMQNERLAAIGQMMTGLAHESGNALARSQSCLEMLAWEVEDRPEALDLIARIQKAQDHLKQLYEEVRGYAAPLRLEREDWELSAVWRQAWEILAHERKGREASLTEQTSGIDLHCSVDQFRLNQVFRNILENSLAACTDPVRIEVNCLETQIGGRHAVRVEVRDNGPGLNPEQSQRIFEPFFTTKTKGTGLGMAIAKRIVEAHGGWIAVGPSPLSHSPEGRGEGVWGGAQIIIVLPRENL